MTALLLDGKATAAKLKASLKKEIEQLTSPPHIYVLLSHPHPASEIYVKAKKKACQEVGAKVTVDTTPYEETQPLIRRIHELNTMKEVHAILVQLPLHPAIDTEMVLEAIDPKKDVDGIHPINMGKLACGDRSGFISCTPLGILRLLENYHIPLAGKRITILGRSRIVGTPLMLLLSRPWPETNATVTLAHSKTAYIEELCRESDILIAAVGKPNLVNAEMVREGAVVIDVGINRIPHPTDPTKKIMVGDCDFQTLLAKASYITPVPGGIGPMTIAALLENSYKAALALQTNS